MKFFFLIIIPFLLNCCGYPDIDNVPNFDDISLTNNEIKDYCENSNIKQQNIDKCVNDYKRKK